MIIIRTPYRISFFGGGTDYPIWYNSNRGAVLSTTVNKYSFLVLRKLPDIFDYKYRIRYFDRQETINIDDINVPVVREIIKYCNFTQGLEITHHGDLPNRSGIGSSSSFTVSLIHGIACLQNKILTKRDLAQSAIHIEQNILQEAVGSQDQVAAAFGGFNRIDFGGHANFTCTPLPIAKHSLDNLESWVQLFFTDQLRNSYDIADKKITNIKNNNIDLSWMLNLLEEAQSHLLKNNIEEFAKLLNIQWKLKKEIEKSISNNSIDTIYNLGIKAGAIGGKLLGAGGGGFMLFLTPPEKQPVVAKALGLKEVSIDFEYLGSQMIYYDYQDLEYV